jgi:hypothetical protein
MACLFLNSEYIDVVLCCESAEVLLLYVLCCAGVLLEPREFLGMFDLNWYNCSFKRERVENAATTIRNNRGVLERVEKSFRRRLRYCIDNNGGHFEHFV